MQEEKGFSQREKGFSQRRRSSRRREGESLSTPRGNLYVPARVWSYIINRMLGDIGLSASILGCSGTLASQPLF
jgi:hypothetical protein